MRLLRVLSLLLLGCLFTGALSFAEAQTFETLYQYENGANPRTSLCIDNDSVFYGTTYAGGNRGLGSIFKVTPTGTLTTLASFGGTSNGSNPLGRLLRIADGSFYGTTFSGGDSNLGTIFKVTPNGQLTTLVHFAGSNGSSPESGLILGPDGAFYGTTHGGGLTDAGTIFKVTANGAQTTLFSFDYNVSGYGADGGLTLGNDGNFYGTTRTGGATGYGTFFKMTPAGALIVLGNFPSAAVGNSPDPLVQGADGGFYGVSPSGGANGNGAIFRITTTGVITTFAQFSNTTFGKTPTGALLIGKDGNFYGVAQAGGSTATGTIYRLTTGGVLSAFSRFAQTSQLAASFGGLVYGSDGGFYGSTSVGGTLGVGSIFKVAADSTFSTLVSFRGNFNPPTVADCAGVGSKLILGTDGAFYGTTYQGGASNLGSVFRFTPGSAPVTLASFTGAANGANPYGALRRGDDGNFYGTAVSGGANNYGTIFKITPAGALTILYHFNQTSGSAPYGALAKGSDGNFYGTTYTGGANNYGTVFRITPDGTLATLLSFNGTKGCYYPYAGLTLGSDGNFYGATAGRFQDGAIFKVTPAGALTVLHTFGANGVPGEPCAALVEGTVSGTFYGTLFAGGSKGGGAIFKITTSGDFTLLRESSYTANSTGISPHAELTLGADGNLYSAFSDGGDYRAGSLFGMTPDGSLTVLKTFDGSSLGYCPTQAPVFGADGNLYGTANNVIYRYNLSAALTPTQSWRQQYFGTTANAGNAADNADPDNDGISNLMEYALGLDPTKPSVAGLPAIGQSSNFLTLTATKNPTATDLTYSAESSSDLIAWSNAGVTVLTNNADTFLARDNTAVSTNAPRRFLRLRVAHP